MNEGTPEEVLKKIFRVFDVNGDGSITMKELTKLIKVGATLTLDLLMILFYPLRICTEC